MTHNRNSISSEAPPSIVAQELIDWIIDWVAILDPASLPACSLVSRDWVYRSQHHIHCSIAIDIDQRSGRIPFDMYSTGVAGLVKHVKIYGLSAMPQAWPMKEGDCADAIIRIIICRLYNLERLSLHGFEAKTHGYTSHSCSTSPTYHTMNVPSVRAVVLEASHFDTLDTLLTFISSFPQLESLEMSDVSLFDPANSDKVNNGQKSTLNYLSSEQYPFPGKNIRFLSLRLGPRYMLDKAAQSYIVIAEALAKHRPSSFHLRCPILADLLSAVLPLLAPFLDKLTLTTWYMSNASGTCLLTST